MRGKKNKSLILLLFCLCFLIGLGSKEIKADLVVKIGYVDLERIFHEYERTKGLEAKLKMENESDQQMLSERRQEIEKLKQALEMQKLILSESAKEEKQAELEQKIEELDKLSRGIEQRSRERETKYTDEILKDLQSKLPLIIKSIAEKEGYRFIFDVRSLFYVTPEEEFDLTNKVLTRLNEEFKLKTEKGE